MDTNLTWMLGSQVARHEHGKRNHAPGLKPKACQHMVLLVQSCAICLGFRVSHEMFLEVLSTLQQWTSEDSISLLDRLPKCSIGHGLKCFNKLKVYGTMLTFNLTFGHNYSL